MFGLHRFFFLAWKLQDFSESAENIKLLCEKFELFDKGKLQAMCCGCRILLRNREIQCHPSSKGLHEIQGISYAWFRVWHEPDSHSKRKFRGGEKVCKCETRLVAPWTTWKSRCMKVINFLVPSQFPLLSFQSEHEKRFPMSRKWLLRPAQYSLRLCVCRSVRTKDDFLCSC